MIKRILFVLSIMAVLLTACGAQTPAIPTISPGDIQNTAAAAAFTMIAATQMALPTATLVPPPTETPLPSPTPLPTFTPEVFIPTPDMLAQPTLPLEPLAPPTATVSTFGNDPSGLGECNRMIFLGEAGPTYPVQIQNVSGGEALLSLYLNKNTFGQCGYMPGVPLVRGGITMNLPTGTWSFFALIKFSKNRSGQANGVFVVQPGGSAVVKISTK